MVPRIDATSPTNGLEMRALVAGADVAEEDAMRLSTRLVLSAAVVAMGASASLGCNGSKCGAMDVFSAGPDRNAGPPNAGSTGTGSVEPASAARAISEADIVQLDHEQNRIYAMSKAGTLAMIDASKANALTLLGKVGLSGQPFEMYRRGDILLTMANHGVSPDGKVAAPLPEGALPPPPNERDGALISAVDIKDPANAKSIASFQVPGEIADSRIVGDILYVATYENAQCYGCAPAPRTLVTTFDVSNPSAPKQIDQIGFGLPINAAQNTAWDKPWKRSVIATTGRLYIGGLSDTPLSATSKEGVIDVLDISDPSGHITRGASIATPGPIMSRWQMDETDGMLRVVSQRGAGRTRNGEAFPSIDTFTIESSKSFLPLGHTMMKLPRQEGLKTVRFDGTRGYAITFNQTDPLFTIDLADAANPVQKGELVIPGWVFHLEPRGDRLIGLGLDRTDPAGNLNVSLFDVADLAKPTMLERVSFGPTGHLADESILNTVLAEDQDRIQKAFRIYDDGLIAVPFTSSMKSYYGSQDVTYACSQNGLVRGGVQLIDLGRTSLTRRAALPMAGNARRVIRRDSATTKEIIGVSDTNITAFAIEQRDAIKINADLAIGTCGLQPQGGYAHGPMNDTTGYDRGMGYDSSWSGDVCE